jgi:plasmid stabilization system protein ParE
MKVELHPQAAGQVRAVDAWWREHRLNSPDLFLHELRYALTLLAEFPAAGRPLRHRRFAGLRRYLLSGTRYHIYYHFQRDEQAVLILAVWSAVRRRGPVLPRV